MNRITTPAGVTVSYDKYGNGAPLVLVHGSFSAHDTNWEFVKPMFREHFTVYAIARRGRGETDATKDHRLEDEAADVVGVLKAVGEPAFLLGHSYGAHCSLAAAAQVPDHVRKLVIYEPAWPQKLPQEALAPLERLAAKGSWDDFAMTFFREVLTVPAEVLEEVRRTELWPPIVADAPASLGDIRSISRYVFEPERFARLDVPVLLQIGSESPRDLYVTDAVAAVLPNARIEELSGQAHEGMTTAPEMYARSVINFLLG